MTCIETANWLLNHNNFLILTHCRPDGDTVGSAAGLCHSLQRMGKTAFVFENTEISDTLAPYLKDLSPPTDYQAETVITVDIAAEQMFPLGGESYLQRGINLAIDHHPSHSFFAEHTCLDHTRGACGEIIFEIVSTWNIPLDKAALPLYIAIATDTGCFQYGNTTSNTHRVAADLMEYGFNVRDVNRVHFATRSYKRVLLEGMLAKNALFYNNGETVIATLTLSMMQEINATKEDAENISAFIGTLQGVSVAATLRENVPGEWKLSLRTDPRIVDASAICAHFDGGGHSAAAGGIFRGTMQQAQSAVKAAIEAEKNNK